MKSAYQWGLDHDSCQEALEQRKALGPNKTQADWWLVCNRGDWLIWQLQRLNDDELQEVTPALLRAINTIADRAVKNYALKCGIPEVEQWTEIWLSGEDRSAEAAWAAARAAAWAAARAATWAAAWAAEAAARAAEAVARAAKAAARAAEAAEAAASWAAKAATWAARAVAKAAASGAAERKQQADDIRAEIPEWVWS